MGPERPPLFPVLHQARPFAMKSLVSAATTMKLTESPDPRSIPMPKDVGKQSKRPILEAHPRFSPMSEEDRHEGEWQVTFIGPTASKSSKNPKADSAP